MTYPGKLSSFEIGVAFDKIGLDGVVDGDFTNLYRYHEGGVIDRGRGPYSAQYSVGTYRGRFVNIDGNFNPDNSASPYFGKLGPDHPFRIKANGVHRMLGLTAEWRVTEVDAVGAYSTAELTAYDTLWLPARTDMDGVGFRELVLGWTPAPTAYYRMGERDTGSRAYDETGNRNHGVYSWATRVGTSGLLTADNNGATDFGSTLIPTFSTPTRAGFSGSGACGLAMIVRPSEFAFLQLAYCGGAFRIQEEADGKLTLQRVGTATSGTTSQPMTLNEPNLIVFRRASDGTTWELVLMLPSGGQSTVTLAGVAGFNFAHPVTLTLKGVIDEVVVWSSADPGAGAYLSLYHQAFVPGGGDTGPLRFSSLLALAKVPAAYISSLSGALPYASVNSFGAYTTVPGSKVIDPLRTLAESETAEIYAAHNGVITRKPYSLPTTAPAPAVTFHDVAASGNPTSVRRVPTRGEQDRRRRVKVSGGSGTAIVETETEGVATADDTVSIFPTTWTDTALDVAQRRARIRRDPGSRLDPITARLSGMTTAQRNAVLGLDMTSQIASVRSGVSVAGKVVRLRDVITPDEYEIEHYTEPNPPTYLPTSRATSPVDAIVSSTADDIGLGGEDWDNDGMHPTAQTGSSVVPTATFLHDGARHLVAASSAWYHQNVGVRQTEIGDLPGTTIYGRVTHPAFGSVDGGLGLVQVVGSIIEVSNTGVTLRLRTTGDTSAFATTTRSPEMKFAPSLTVVRLPSAAHAVRAKRTTSQSITTGGGGQVVTLDAESFDTNGMHSTATNTERLTTQKAAWFFALAQLAYAANATGRRLATLRVNGVNNIGIGGSQSAGGSDQTVVQASSLWKAASGDYFDMLAFQDSGSTLTADVVSQAAPVFSAIELAGPGARRTHSVAYDGAGGNPAKIANATDTRLTFDTVRVDDNSLSTSTRITADRDGVWLPWTGVRWGSNTTGERAVWFLLNGADIIAEIRQGAMQTGLHYQTLWVPWLMEEGDYVEVWVYQDSGAALDIVKNTDNTPEFAMAFVGDTA